jgi:hypothetical protein
MDRKADKIMRNIQILAFTLFAICAFSASAAMSASAGELLLNGAKITGEIPIQVTGEMLFEDMGASGIPDLLCSGIAVGHTVTGTLGFGTAVLTLAGVETGGTVECTDDKNVCSGAVLLTSLNLPWHIEIELMTAGINEFLALTVAEVGKVPMYQVDCNSLLGLITDECEGVSSGRLENTAEGLLLEIGGSAETAPGSCSLGGANQELLESLGKLIVSSSSGTLAVS